MLTNPELLRIFSKLMAVCIMFTNCMQVQMFWEGGGESEFVIIIATFLSEYLHEDACFLCLEVHSKHEVRASFS